MIMMTLKDHGNDWRVPSTLMYTLDAPIVDNDNSNDDNDNCNNDDDNDNSNDDDDNDDIMIT